jgi:hypothetical protein
MSLDFLYIGVPHLPWKGTTALCCKCITIIGGCLRSRQAASGAARPGFSSWLHERQAGRGGDATGFAVARLAPAEYVSRLEKLG